MDLDGHEDESVSKLNHGIVFFDDTHSHQAGWAAKSDEPARRITGSEELCTDTVWITNLPYDLANVTGWTENTRFRVNEFLREKIDSLAKRLNLLSSKRKCEELARIFKRVMTVSEYALDVETPPVDYKLAKGLRRLLGGFDPILPHYEVEAMESATQYWTRCERQLHFSKDDVVVYFKCPPFRHAKSILETTLPAGEWKTLSKEELPHDNDVLKWLEIMPNPFIAKVKLSDFDPAVNDLVNFGAGKGKKRIWVTNVDLEQLVHICRVTVYEVIMSSQQISLKSITRSLEKFPELAPLSISCGIFVENLWCSFAATNPPPARGRRQKKGRPTNPNIPFIRASDRVLCFMAALRLKEFGIEVMGYATGTLWANCAGWKDDEIAEAALQAAVIPPMAKRRFNLADPPVETPESLLYSLFATGRLDDLLEMDRKIVEELPWPTA